MALAGGIGVLAYRLFLAEQRLDALEDTVAKRRAMPTPNTFRPVAAPPCTPGPPPAAPPSPAEESAVDAAAKVPAQAQDSDEEEGPP